MLRYRNFPPFLSGDPDLTTLNSEVRPRQSPFPPTRKGAAPRSLFPIAPIWNLRPSPDIPLHVVSLPQPPLARLSWKTSHEEPVRPGALIPLLLPFPMALPHENKLNSARIRECPIGGRDGEPRDARPEPADIHPPWLQVASRRSSGGAGTPHRCRTLLLRWLPYEKKVKLQSALVNVSWGTYGEPRRVLS